jgi:hypothetical protein
MPPAPNAVPALTLDALIQALVELRARQPELGTAAVELPYDPGHTTLGSHPAVGITRVSAGFDWDMGRVFLSADRPVGIPEQALRARQRYFEDALLSVRLTLRPRTDSEAPTPEKQLARITGALDALDRRLKALPAPAA